MTQQTSDNILLLLITKLVKSTLESPDSPLSNNIAKSLSKKVGINAAELVRFHRAVLKNSTTKAFSPAKVSLIASIALKEEIRLSKRLPSAGTRGHLSEVANELNIQFNDLLEVSRGLYIEVVNEVLKAQS